MRRLQIEHAIVDRDMQVGDRFTRRESESATARSHRLRRVDQIEPRQQSAVFHAVKHARVCLVCRPRSQMCGDDEPPGRTRNTDVRSPVVTFAAMAASRSSGGDSRSIEGGRRVPGGVAPIHVTIVNGARSVRVIRAVHAGTTTP